MLKESAITDILPKGKAGKKFDPVGFLKRYGVLVVLLSCVITAVIAPFVLILRKPWYEVHSFMQLNPVTPTLITKSDESSLVSFYHDHANTLAHAMTTHDILAKTVAQLTPRQKSLMFPRKMPVSQCADMLAGSISVKPIRGTHLLDITIGGTRREGLAPVLNTLMKVYMAEDRRKSNITDNERLKYLYDQKQQVQMEMAAIAKDLDTLTANISTSTFSEAYNIAGKNNEDLLKIYNNALNERIKAETRYQEVKNLNRDMRAISLDPLVEEMVASDPSLNFTDSWTYQKLQEMRSSTDGMTAVNPDRIYVEQRMDAMQQYRNKLRKAVRNTASGIVYGKRSIDMRKELAMARHDYEKSKKAEEQVKKVLDENVKESKRVSIGIHKGEYLTSFWQHKHDVLNNIDNRITEIELERKAPLHLSIESFARTPDKPMNANAGKLLTMLMGSVFAFVGGTFFLIEFFDKTIRRPDDVTHALGSPPTQTVECPPLGTPAPEAGSLTPESVRCQAFESLAVKFCREKEQNGAKTLLFTGTDADAASSFIAASLANALSRIVPKVLLLACGTTGWQEMTDRENAPYGAGFNDYLDGNGDWRDLVHHATSPGMDIIHAGSYAVGNANRHRLQELLQELGKEYDFICLDAPPILQASFTEHLAIYSDIATLVCTENRSNIGELRSSAEQLIRLGIPGIAPVLDRREGATQRTDATSDLKQSSGAQESAAVRFRELLNTLPSSARLSGMMAAMLADLIQAVLRQVEKRRSSSRCKPVEGSDAP